MAAKHDAVINELNNKVDKLIKQHIISLEEQKKLLQKQEELLLELENVKRENKILNDKIKVTRVANAISGGEEGAHEAKMRINRLVREIDKCITLLNN